MCQRSDHSFAVNYVPGGVMFADKRKPVSILREHRNICVGKMFGKGRRISHGVDREIDVGGEKCLWHLGRINRF